MRLRIRVFTKRGKGTMSLVRQVSVALVLLCVIALNQKTPAQTIDSPPADQRPPMLQKVGIQQQLNQQIPPDLEFRDESGQPVRLGQYFARRPLILNLVYYNCPMLCGEVLNGLTSSLKVMKLDLGRDFDIITVSFDPRETPALATAKKAIYLQRYHRPGADAGWHFLTGTQQSIVRLTQAAGFQYQFDGRTGQFAHATAILVLTPQGKISQYYYGVEYSPRDLRLGLIQASNNQIGTLIDQVLLYCYHYNPATGKYGAMVTRLMRVSAAATILILGALIVVLFRLGPKQSQEGRVS
jgi:protein SCO1/2